MDILDALSDHGSVRHVTTRHEQGAAFMADVYGRLTGRAAVAMATLGPGATNLVTGVADAFLDRAPSFIAHQARTRQGAALKTALDAHAAARDLAGAARGLSLDASGTIFEMAGLVARLHAA